MNERRNTTMVVDRSADLFVEARSQITLLEYLAKQHKALDGQFPAHFSTQAAEAVHSLQQTLHAITNLFPSNEERELSGAALIEEIRRRYPTSTDVED